MALKETLEDAQNLITMLVGILRNKQPSDVTAKIDAYAIKTLDELRQCAQKTPITFRARIFAPTCVDNAIGLLPNFEHTQLPLKYLAGSEVEVTLALTHKPEPVTPPPGVFTEEEGC